MTDPLVRVENLSVRFRRGADDIAAVRRISFDLHPGRVTAIVGESGSGKSVTARSLLGLAGRNAEVRADTLTIEGQDARALTEREWRRVRGARVGLILQDALTSLDPLRTVRQEVEETLKAHGMRDSTTRIARVREALEEAGLADPDRFLDRRSYQLSGGQRQRVLIAQALAASPRILIADEPTTALDATVQAGVLRRFGALRDSGHAILLITHDLGVVQRLADEVLVMKDGVVVESGARDEVLRRPRTAYTRALIDAVPTPSRKGSRLAGPAPVMQAVPRPYSAERTAAVIAADLTLTHPQPRGTTVRAQRALDGVSFTVWEGTTLGIVGESGSGKSTLAWVLAALASPDAGEVTLFGRPWTTLPERDRVRRRNEIQVVYQDALSSFDPRHTVQRILDDALRVRRVPRHARPTRVSELLAAVSLDLDLAVRRPLDLSGGQRQRVSIARALALEPRILVLDEPVSALDASVQATILDLLQDLQRALGLTYVFISHDLGVVHHMSDDVIVMRHGSIVEAGPAGQVLREPTQPYTRELVASVAGLEEVTAG